MLHSTYGGALFLVNEVLTHVVPICPYRKFIELSMPVPMNTDPHAFPAPPICDPCVSPTHCLHIPLQANRPQLTLKGISTVQKEIRFRPVELGPKENNTLAPYTQNTQTPNHGPDYPHLNICALTLQIPEDV